MPIFFFSRMFSFCSLPSQLSPSLTSSITAGRPTERASDRPINRLDFHGNPFPSQKEGYTYCGQEISHWTAHSILFVQWCLGLVLYLTHMYDASIFTVKLNKRWLFSPFFSFLPLPLENARNNGKESWCSSACWLLLLLQLVVELRVHEAPIYTERSSWKDGRKTIRIELAASKHHQRLKLSC